MNVLLDKTNFCLVKQMLSMARFLMVPYWNLTISGHGVPWLNYYWLPAPYWDLIKSNYETTREYSWCFLVFLLEFTEIQPWNFKVRLLMISYWNIMEIQPWDGKVRLLMVSYWNLLKSIEIYWNPTKRLWGEIPNGFPLKSNEI